MKLSGSIFERKKYSFKNILIIKKKKKKCFDDLISILNIIIYIVYKKWKVSKNNYLFIFFYFERNLHDRWELRKIQEGSLSLSLVHSRSRRDKIFDQLHCPRQSATQIYRSRATRATSNACLRTEDIKLLTRCTPSESARAPFSGGELEERNAGIEFRLPFMHKELLFRATSFQVFRYLFIYG